ncbi:MAG: hypothetical protein ABH882_02970 [Candidatus Omnitrophota bacterium]|nr:hypothetical protein [Candidatus Omnitrophota bacterium]MBU1928962.1 hypothetical protein [Candidatus Omnitrophota bacterium]MBU2035719.1 hypothetical protein [Candidatus Omnitrophota bacterium]MBU2258346.1 hypothetical protein [Candidatus Omnitrophota bacterium]
MRDLLYKNLTSLDKKKRIIASSETLDKEGLRRVIHRHFVYMVKEAKQQDNSKPTPYVYVLKERNNAQQKEKFFCRIKGSMYLTQDNKLYLIVFMHSLKISLEAMPNPVSN